MYSQFSQRLLKEKSKSKRHLHCSFYSYCIQTKIKLNMMFASKHLSCRFMGWWSKPIVFKIKMKSVESYHHWNMFKNRDKLIIMRIEKWFLFQTSPNKMNHNYLVATTFPSIQFTAKLATGGIFKQNVSSQSFLRNPSTRPLSRLFNYWVYRVQMTRYILTLFTCSRASFEYERNFHKCRLYKI